MDLKTNNLISIGSIPVIDGSDPEACDAANLGEHITEECISFIEHQGMFTEAAISQVRKILEHDFMTAISEGRFGWKLSDDELRDLLQ